jgi:hypothetical protein
MAVVASDTDRASETPPREPRDETDALPFSVEILDRTGGDRILARAASASLARAIFGAARSEYPNARVVLKRGPETILDSEIAG